MITILAIAITWYATKIYYTHSFGIKLVNSGLYELRCASCSKLIFRSPENIRTSNYCTNCN